MMLRKIFSRSMSNACGTLDLNVQILWKSQSQVTWRVKLNDKWVVPVDLHEQTLSSKKKETSNDPPVEMAFIFF